MKEINIQNLIRLALSKIGVTTFRNNTAMGWAGKVFKFSKRGTVNVEPGDVLVKNAYPLHAGLCVGSSDLIGYNQDGTFIGIEVKQPGKNPTDEQQNFIDKVNESNGIAFVARSPEEAVDKVNPNNDGKGGRE